MKHIFNISASRPEYLDVLSACPDEIPIGVHLSRTMPGSTTLAKIFCYKTSALSDLGKPAPNSTLREADFYEMPVLVNLGSLAETTGIEELRIFRCDALQSVEEAKSGNTFERLSIVGCALLPTEMIRLE